MNRALAVASAFYLPHLLEEALTGMHDDALIVAAFAPLANLEPRHAAYLVFQLTFAKTRKRSLYGLCRIV